MNLSQLFNLGLIDNRAALLQQFIILVVQYVTNYDGDDLPERLRLNGYDYKWNGEAAVGDQFVVPVTMRGQTVFKVARVIAIKQDFDINVGYKLRWAVQRIDTTTFEANAERDQRFDAALKKLDAALERAAAKKRVEVALSELDPETAAQLREELGLGGTVASPPAAPQ